MSSNKVLVSVITSQGFQKPAFSQCILTLIEPKSDIIKVDFLTKNDQVVIKKGVLHSLQHSPICPFRELETSAENVALDRTRGRGVAVAVSIVLESRDMCVLLTKRPDHMRTSPGVWVPPGGHLETGEQLLECGGRELHEETGLSLKDDCDYTSARILCLWENAFPLSLGLGPTQTHTLVVYYHVQSPYTHQQLTSRMRIDPQEVGCFTWLPAKVLKEIFDPSIGQPSYAIVQHVWENGTLVEKRLNYLKMYNRYVWTNSEIYSGVMCALTKWYNTLKHPSLDCKI